ncbi:hypothetical protein [Halalkalibacter akibai]|uniref:Uncharacterized protein n=1 Tax=Halalkalibacter akibai (strain ATCC 43226 / DSM 21942 / CIP 109018 / JCM 9157 / 1139) TaxID=1236973 RepID=W4QXR6_HALA3|nr:hypothetical protein [Halalkalibacter akibai]GAE36891.1 hypothetical protein JCM9157_4115 [Halalkalibacter akibai JCM 9157]
MSMIENQYVTFLQSPYRFLDKTVCFWKDAVQSVINEIVLTFSRIPHSTRTYLKALHIIGHYWSRLDKSIFESERQFVMTSVKVTDHLLSLLMSEKHIEEVTIQIDMLMESDNIIINEDGLILEKILLEVDEEMLSTYWNAALQFCLELTENLPKQIEVFDVLNGKRYVHFPQIS